MKIVLGQSTGKWIEKLVVKVTNRDGIDRRETQPIDDRATPTIGQRLCSASRRGENIMFAQRECMAEN